MTKCKNCGHELVEEKGKYRHRTSDYKEERCMALLDYTSEQLFYCNCKKPVPEKIKESGGINNGQKTKTVC